MSNYKIEQVRGVRDVLWGEFRNLKWIEDHLLKYFELFGYLPVLSPIIEHSELYLRKSGEDIVSRMYDFNYKNRRICLRPEMTASVIRLFIDNLQDKPLPLRLSYSGPVFRYEKPQKARYRQFTQVGIELIGASGSGADAEVMQVACKALENVGLEKYRLVVGHVGILSEFLTTLGLQKQLRNFLILNMENLRKRKPDYIMEQMKEIFPAFAEELPTTPSNIETTFKSKKLIEILKEMDEDEARQAVTDFLESLNIQINSNRSETEIVDRLLSKIRQEDQIPKLKKALEFMGELGQLVGEPSLVLSEASKLLNKYGTDPRSIEHVQATLKTFNLYSPINGEMVLDFGLNRGLQYYTGMVFEIHHNALGDERQLCGGGRYDDLITLLGGTKEISATGFAYGLERILFALEYEHKLKQSIDSVLQVFIVPVDDTDIPYAIKIAETLRKVNVPVELQVRARSLGKNLQYAHRRGIPLAVIVGSKERENDELILRNLQTKQEYRIGLSEVVAKVKEEISNE